MGHLQLYLSGNPFVWFLRIFGFFVSIDGKQERRGWGWHTFELPEGPHTIECWWRWMFIPWSRESITIVVSADVVTRVAYEAGQFWGEIRIAHPQLDEVPEARLLPAKKR